MKKLYTFFLLTTLAVAATGQTYHPLLDSVNVWSYASHFLGVRQPEHTQSGPCTYPFSSPGSFKQYTGADTLIGSYVYKPVYNDNLLCTMGYIREDTAAQKVYFIANTDTTEKLLYDFSMVQGDTMTISFLNSNGYYPGVYTLDTIETVYIQSGPRRAFRLSNHAMPGAPVLSWIESVGSMNDLCYPYFDNQYSYGPFSGCPGEQHQFYQFLICFEHQTKVYYDSCSLQIAMASMTYANYIDSCNYWYFTGGVNELRSVSSLEVFPNPSSGATTLRMDVTQRDEFEVYIRDVSGRQILQHIPLGKLPEGRKEITLDLSALPEGFYLVEVRSPEGSAYRKLVIQH